VAADDEVDARHIAGQLHHRSAGQLQHSCYFVDSRTTRALSAASAGALKGLCSIACSHPMHVARICNIDRCASRGLNIAHLLVGRVADVRQAYHNVHALAAHLQIQRSVSFADCRGHWTPLDLTMIALHLALVPATLPRLSGHAEIV
jgi:hypothetical protein